MWEGAETRSSVPGYAEEPPVALVSRGSGRQIGGDRQLRERRPAGVVYDCVCSFSLCEYSNACSVAYREIPPFGCSLNYAVSVSL